MMPKPDGKSRRNKTFGLERSRKFSRIFVAFEVFTSNAHSWPFECIEAPALSHIEVDEVRPTCPLFSLCLRRSGNESGQMTGLVTLQKEEACRTKAVVVLPSMGSLRGHGRQEEM